MEKRPTHVPSVLDKTKEFKNLAALELALEESENSLTLEFPSYTDVKQILGGVKSWLLIFYAYGFDFSSLSQSTLTRQVQKSCVAACRCSVVTSWMTYFKFKNASFMAANCPDQVLPALPHPLYRQGNHKYLFGGAFARYQNVLIRADQMYSFATSILQSKKGMPRPTNEMVAQAERDNVRTMTSLKEQSTWEYEWEPIYAEKSIDWPQNKITLGRSFLEGEIDRTVTELFSKWKPDLDLLTRIFLPSTSSNYNWTRAKYGTYGELQVSQMYKRLRAELEGDSNNKLKPEDWIPFRYRMTKLSGFVSDYYGQKGKEDLQEHIDSVLEVLGGEYDCRLFLSRWKRFYWRCVSEALIEPPFVQVVGLKEALKVRCISKGPPLTYFVLKPLQKSLWGHLQKTWNFELTGTPITEELMNERFAGLIGARMHSGDYKAATDELHSWCSERACDALFNVAERNLGYKLTPFRTLTKRALTGHVYKHAELELVLRDDFDLLPLADQVKFFTETKILGEEPDAPFRFAHECQFYELQKVTHWTPQRRGQLMGSIVSFPFLCILNATLIRKTYELSEGLVSKIKDCPFWINGDDCLTAYHNHRFPEIWRGLGSVMGFQESVGKTYDSPEFCSINSTTFRLKDGRWELVPQINLGLLEGLDRSGGDSNEKDRNPANLGVWQSALLDWAPKDQAVQERLDLLFCRRHRETLQTFNGTWHLPCWAGGLGLHPPLGYSKLDRLHAGRVKLYSALSGKEPPQLPHGKDWVHFDKFNERVRTDLPLVDRYFFEKHEFDSEYGTAFCCLVWREFLTQGVESLYQPMQTEYEAFMHSQRRYMRGFQKALGESPELQGAKKVPAEEIEREVKVRVYPVWGRDWNEGAASFGQRGEENS